MRQHYLPPCPRVPWGRARLAKTIRREREQQRRLVEGEIARAPGWLQPMLTKSNRGRRVYDGSWPVAVLEGLGVAAIYLTLWSTVVLGVTMWASAVT